MKCNIENKIKFVKSLSESIVPFKSGVVSIDYRVFEYPEKGWTQEYLVINYDGGSKTVRNCNGNSFSSILQEVSRYLDSGYYDEVDDLKYYENSPNWIELN